MGERRAGVRRPTLHGARLRARGGPSTLRTLAIASLLLAGACSLRGPGDVELAPRTHLKLARDLLFLPPDEAATLMRSLGERPGAPVLGAVLTTDETPRMLVLYDGGLDERGQRKIDFVGWDDAPGARSLVQELLPARARN